MSSTTLTAVALAGILAIARSPAVDVVAERPRLEAFAADIAGVVEQRDQMAHWLPGAVLPLPLRGDAAAEGAALMLVAIAAHESGFRADVADCRRVGADQPSITAYQLLGRFARGPYTRAQLCASPRRASERTLAVLSHYGARCRRAICLFRGYASGDPANRTDAARRQCALWERLLAGAALRGGCGSRRVTHGPPGAK